MTKHISVDRVRHCNVATTLRNRSRGFSRFSGSHNALEAYVEHCAATMCTDNHKIELPARTRSTFMTAFSPDHTLVASCHGDHNIHVTNLKTEKHIKSLVGHERSPWCISFHPSSRDILATGCLNGEVRVWDLRGGGSEVWIAPNDNVTIASLSFHPTDQVLLIAGGNEIYFWDWSLPKPFASVKTSSIHEKVRLVRFDMFGSRILTGVVNEDNPNSGGEEDGEDSDAVDWGLPPPRPTASHSPNTRMPRERRLPDWAMSSLLSMSSVSWQFFNNRRRDERPLPEPPATTQTQETTAGVSSAHYQLGTVRERLMRARSSLDTAAPATDGGTHTYARDHERILNARVSVNAEIQHQYNRLQLLRQERRRLELRLQQIRERRSGEPMLPGAHSGPTRVSRPFPLACRTPQQTSPPRPSVCPSRPLHRARSIRERRMARFNPSSVQERILESLSNVEMMVSVGSTSTSSSNNSTSTSQDESSSSTTPSSTAAAGVSSPLPVGMMEEPLEEPDISLSSYNTHNPSVLLPPAINFPEGWTRSTLLPEAPPYPTPITTPLFLTTPRVNLETPEPPPPEPAFSRTTTIRNRIRQSRSSSRRHARRLRNINHYLSFYPGHNAPDPTTYRLQWWDFTKLDLPEIGRPDVNVLVQQCKIYNDSSVDLAKDGSKLAAFVPAELGFQDSMKVAVYSLEPGTLGHILFRKSIGPNAVCLSLSPLAGYVAVGVKNRMYPPDGRQFYRCSMAQVFKVNGNETNPVHQINHPVIPDTPQRFVNINTIAWLPTVGQGIVYGTNNGELRICHTKPS